MAAGLEVYNTSGTVVTSTSSNLFAQSLVYNPVLVDGQEFNFSAQVPQIAGPGYTFLRTTGNNTWNLIGRNFSGSQPFYIFDANVPPAPGNAGLEVYNDNGILIFSSNIKPLRVVDIIEAADIDSVTGDRYYVPGRNYSGIVLNPGWKFTRAVAGGGFFLYYFKRASLTPISGGINISAVETLSVNGPAQPSGMKVLIAIIDVTNL